MCISELDFNAMFKSNSSHPERFSHITVLRQVQARGRECPDCTGRACHCMASWHEFTGSESSIRSSRPPQSLKVAVAHRRQPGTPTRPSLSYIRRCIAQSLMCTTTSTCPRSVISTP